MYASDGTSGAAAMTANIGDGPHAIPWTHAGQVNAALLDFVGR
jgi:hypothetical protein